MPSSTALSPAVHQLRILEPPFCRILSFQHLETLDIWPSFNWISAWMTDKETLKQAPVCEFSLQRLSTSSTPWLPFLYHGGKPKITIVPSCV